MRLRLTVEDAGAYMRPWTAEVQFTLIPDTPLLEFVCENEKFGSKQAADRTSGWRPFYGRYGRAWP